MPTGAEFGRLPRRGSTAEGVAIGCRTCPTAASLPQMVRTSVQAPCAHIPPPIRGSEAGSVGERRWFRLPLSAVGLIAALVAAAAAPAAAGAGTPLPRPFAANGFWNAPLPTATAVDPRSPELVGDLVRQA